MKQSSATRTSSPRIVMPRARTISSSFSISIQPRTAFLCRRSGQRPRCGFVPIQLRRISPRPIISSGVERDYDRALEELAIARPGLPNSTPFFILSGYINRRRNHFPEAERDFPPRSRSIREIRMLTIFWPTPTCSNAVFLKRSTFTDSVLAAGEQTPIVRFRRASAILWWTGDTRTAPRDSGRNFRTWNLPAGRRRPRAGWQCSTAIMPKRNGFWPLRLVKIFKTSTSAFIFRRVGSSDDRARERRFSAAQRLRFANVERFWRSD